MNDVFQTARPLGPDSIHQAIAEHGAFRVLRVALRALLHRKSRPDSAMLHMSDRMRRDIGLEPEDDGSRGPIRGVPLPVPPVRPFL
jgi:hypothetical protein